MSDNLRRYQAIKQALLDLYPKGVKGRQLQALRVLAMYINGIVGSGSTNAREVAKKTPTAAKPSSREKQLYRWYENEKNDYATHFLPFVQALLLGLSDRTFVFAMDGSVVGRGCVCLMVTLIYKQRAIPIAWQVIQGEKGHFPATMHIELLKQVKELLPDDASVVVIGDGEFDSVALQQTITSFKWEYVCRTANNIQVCYEGEWLSLSDIPLLRGSRIMLSDVAFSLQALSPVNVILWWGKEHKTPVYLVTNLELVDEACSFYKKRMRIETFFSDQKSRGFHIHKSHISEPARLASLLIAACLAYIWIVFLGTLAKVEGWVQTIHRKDRCDLSLFQLGLDLLEYFLNENIPIPVDFRLLSPDFVS